MRIKGKVEPHRLQTKRFYLPGVVIYDECPNCGKTVEFDFDIDYFSYPLIDKPNPIDFQCEACGNEWEKQVLIKLSIKEAV